MVAVGRAIARKRALEMAMSGDPIDARTAESWGLVNYVVSGDELEVATKALMKRVTRGSAVSKGIGKRAFYRQIGMDQDDAYEYAVGEMSAASQIFDAQEGISAFLEKRVPRWETREE
jgi:enoyl-CoA hydratase/carnithine racemase